MQWSGVSYPEFTRTIDITTGRILSQSQAGNTGLTTNYTYDALGRLTRIQPPGEDNTILAYPPWTVGNVIKVYRGPSTTIPSCRVGDTCSLQAEATYTQYTFDDFGRLVLKDTLMPDETWSEQRTAYDPYGKAIFTSIPYNPQTVSMHTRVAFPMASNGGSYGLTLPWNQDGGAMGTWNSYFGDSTYAAPLPSGAGAMDPLHRTLWTIRPDGSITQTAYNTPSGLSTVVTDYDRNNPQRPGVATGQTTTLRDVLGRILSVVPPAGASAAYGYDGLGNLATVTLTGNGTTQVRSFTYDAPGNRLTATNPENGTTDYLSYDALGHLLTYQDSAARQGGYSVAMTYDSKGRILTQGLAGQPPLVNWDYDQPTDPDSQASLGASQGQLTHSETPWAREFYTYSTSTGRLEGRAVTLRKSRDDANPLTYPVSYGYNLMGDLVTESVTLANGTTKTIQVNSTYAHGLLTERVFAGSTALQGVGIDSKQDAVPIQYFPSGALKSVAYSNGTVTTYQQEDATSRLKSITAAYAGGSWTTGNYLYDGVGNIVTIGSDAFTYDDMNRLTQATLYPEGSSASAIVNYTYDDFGNIRMRNTGSTSAFMSGPNSLPAVNFTATYDSATNRIQTFNGSGAIVVYDKGGSGNGLVTFDGTYNYAYDPLNQLLSATLNTNSTAVETYGYDAEGERVYSQQGTTEATYFIRSGSEVLAEDKYDPSMNSHRKKGYLYVGGHLAATEDWEVAGTGTTGSTTQSLMALCPSTYGQDSGTPVLPTLGDPQVTLGHGANYEADYSVSDVGPDVAGLMVRIARIKDQGSSDSGGNGNGVPRNDEDRVQCSFYLQNGLDPDFVFHRYGMANNATYGTIGDLQPGSPILAAFPGLQTGKAYRFTLAIWTSVGADVNLGYNLVILEEGELSVPKDKASSYLFVMNRDGVGGNGQLQGRMHAHWATPDIQGVIGYNMVATLADGSLIALNDTLLTDTDWTQDLAAIASLGVASDAPLILQAVTSDPTPVTLGPLTCGSGDTCSAVTAGTNTARACSPSNVQAMDFSLPGTPKAYVAWTPCATGVSAYKVYRGVQTGTFPPFSYSYIGTTTSSFYWDTAVRNNTTYCYRVLSVGTDGVTLSSLTLPPACVTVSTASGVEAPLYLRAVNTSTTTSGGAGTPQSVRLTWQWGGTLPSGYSYSVYRAYNTAASSCSDVAAEQYQVLASGLTATTYTDTAFGSDPDPQVAYEVGVAYTGAGVVSPFSSCVLTQVAVCSPLPQTPLNLQASLDVDRWQESLSWTPAPDAGAWTSYEVYTGYQPVGLGLLYETTLGTIVTVDLYGYPMGGAVTFSVVAVDSRTGCRSQTASLTVNLPQEPCVPAPAPGLTLTLNGTTVTLTWNPVTVTGPPYLNGYTIWAGVGGCGTNPAMTYRSYVNAGTTSYTETIAAGDVVSYEVTAYTDCDGPPSNCVDTNNGSGPGPGPVPNGDAENYFYVTDHLGSVRLVTSSNGAMVSLHDYEPYGVEMALSTGNPSGNTHKFTGQERDTFTGNDYMHYRFYASSMGRFMRPDNVSGSPLNPQDWNLYSYVHGNPVNFNDPTGHEAGDPESHPPSGSNDPTRQPLGGATSSLNPGETVSTLLVKQLAAANVQVTAEFMKTLAANAHLRAAVIMFAGTKVGQTLLHRFASDKNTTYIWTVAPVLTGSMAAQKGGSLEGQGRGSTDFDPASGSIVTAAGASDFNKVTSTINVAYMEWQYGADPSGKLATRAIAETIGHEAIRADIMGGGRYVNQPFEQQELAQGLNPLEQEYLEELESK